MAANDFCVDCGARSTGAAFCENCGRRQRWPRHPPHIVRRRHQFAEAAWG